MDSAELSADGSIQQEEFAVNAEQLNNNELKFSFINSQGRPLTVAEFIHMLQSSQFCDLLSKTIASVPFTAFFWEMPPVSKSTASSLPFEFVVADSSGLAAVHDGDNETFAEYFSKAPRAAAAVTFHNLGGDSMLVAPTDLAASKEYVHLAKFVRSSDSTVSEQRREFWKLVGKAFAARLAAGDGYTWCSTSGLGVYWLHVRLDSRPKYYTHREYADVRRYA